MPLALTQAQVAAANAESVTTYFLYEIYYDPKNRPGACLRYTNWQPSSATSGYPDLIYNGETYRTIPIKHSDITQGTDGKINDFTVTVGNADRVIQSYIENPDYDLMSGKIRIIQIFKGIDDPVAMTFRIKRATCKKDVAAFTLSIGIDVLGYELPGRKILSRFCWWAFRDTDCKYNGHTETKITWQARGTSATSAAIETGEKTFATQSGQAISVGNKVKLIASGGTANFMIGRVTAYAGTSLTVKVIQIGGSGTFNNWSFKKSVTTSEAVVDAECDRTFEDCKSKNNLLRFGGFPGVLNEHFYF
jgi:phage-related protein